MTSHIAKDRVFRGIFLASLFLTISACQTVNTTQGGAVGVERQQRMAVSAEEMQQAAQKQYVELIAQERKKGTLNRDPVLLSRVRAVVGRIVPQTVNFRSDALAWEWETNVITSAEINAWCMPGGKMAVYTGLIEKLQISDDELAAVMGHEIAHALREHGRERASEQMVMGSIISAGSALLGWGTVGQKGAEYAYMGLRELPNSRLQETEADRMGVELAARAGYDPYAAISLWQKMGRVDKSEPLPFFSTHPSNADRISDLSSYAARVKPLYEQAKKKR